MRFFRLQLLCFVGLMALHASGCHTMNGYATNSSGMGYYEDGNYAAAANEFQQAMLANPSNPDYVANFAKAKLKLGDPQGAEQLYRQSLTMAPSHQPSYHGLAETMMTQGRSDEAASLLTTWAGTQPYVAESHVELAWLQREMGQSDAAAQSLQRALQVNPSHTTALAHLGQYYEESGHPDQAVAVYQRSLQSDWNQPEVHSRIAAASQSAGPGSPMAATAMARGVHPYSVPRQQTAFGPPSRGARMAQMRMAQNQMGMGGNSMDGGQMAASGGWQSANSIMNVPPDQTAAMSFGTGMPGNEMPDMHSSGKEWSSETMLPTATPSAVPANSTPNTAVGPTPDPAFSAREATTPVTNVSWSASSTKTPISGSLTHGLPMVEAF